MAASAAPGLQILSAQGDLHGGKKTGKERFVFVFGLIFLKESPTN